MSEQGLSTKIAADRTCFRDCGDSTVSTMKRAVGIGVPLLLILAVSAYLIGTALRKDPFSEPGHRVIKRSLSLPADLQDALRAAAAEDPADYGKNPDMVKDKRFLPAIANLAGKLFSSGKSVDSSKLTDTIKQLGSMKNMGPDIMAQSVQQESEVTAEVEKEVAKETVDKIFGEVEHEKKDEDGDKKGADKGGGGSSEEEVKAEIDFVAEKGMAEDDMFAPPGMHMKIDVEKDPGKDSEPDQSSQAMAFSYPMGMGSALMNGCFGTGYVAGDPCYNMKDAIPNCWNMMEGCGYIGVGFDGRGDYSSTSRRKTVIQRNCKNRATYHDEDVPDNMNVHGIFDTEVSSYVFESRAAYRSSLQMKAGMSLSGWGFQAAVESAYGKSSSSQKQSFMSLIQANVIRYEIFLDEISPDTLSLAFLRDFLSLPKNFIVGKAKLQKFIIRYGTHFIKSAKFGGSFRLFKKQEASKSESLEDFSVQAQASFNSIFFNAAAHAGMSKSSGSSQSSKESSTHVTIEGGDQEVGSIVADFYSTGFKDTFTEWLKSIPKFPKPIEMFVGTMSELLDLNYKLLFPFDIKDAADGCFSENLKTEEGTGRKYYEVAKLVNNSKGEKKLPINEKRYCDFTSTDKFEQAMDKKRLALERAIAVYMEEGPVPTTDFHLEGGTPGCETKALKVKGGPAGSTHPTWLELINGDTYKVTFDIPEDINHDLRKYTEAYLTYAENRWNCHAPGAEIHMYNSRTNGGSGDTKLKKVSCFGFVMTYDEESGKFIVTDKDQEASTKVFGKLPRDYINFRVARAEYRSPLEHAQKTSGALASIVEAPCTVKWSNSYQIKPAEEGGRCLYFVAASAGDIFVVFSAIPRDKTTWYHLQISYQGVTLYKGMKLVKYEGAKSARSLGDSKLFQPYFICLDEDMAKGETYIKYGIGSDTSETGLVYMVYNDVSPPLGIRFYSFGSGEKDVEIMDARVIDGTATGEMKCTGGTVLKDGRMHSSVSWIEAGHRMPHVQACRHHHCRWEGPMRR
ncbi:Hypp105 [Branchiostoma lanceolatum]|uniref:Hypp105 protein n=2 Tax=Branchiostoma lanceolatum TaxID=7740 RepID=A0A8J9V7H5_BRALA|nr:Hypp105 [Branchiostoma lanceolatum]